MEAKKLTITNFKGLTDHKNTGDPGYAQTQDNLEPSKDGGLETRPGCTFYDDTNKKFQASTSYRTNKLFEHNDEVLGHVQGKILKSDTTWIPDPEYSAADSSNVLDDYNSWTTSGDFTVNAGTEIECDSGFGFGSSSDYAYIVLSGGTVSSGTYVLKTDYFDVFKGVFRIGIDKSSSYDSSHANDAGHTYYVGCTNTSTGLLNEDYVGYTSGSSGLSVGVIDIDGSEDYCIYIEWKAADYQGLTDEHAIIGETMLLPVNQNTTSNFTSCDETNSCIPHNKLMLVTGDAPVYPHMVFTDDIRQDNNSVIVRTGGLSVNEDSNLYVKHYKVINYRDTDRIYFRTDTGLAPGNVGDSITICDSHGAAVFTSTISGVATSSSVDITNLNANAPEVGGGYFVEDTEIGENGSSSYTYKAICNHKYTIDGKQYEIRGVPITIPLHSDHTSGSQTTVGGDGAAIITLSDISAASESDGRDTTNMEIEIYRTDDGGTECKFVSSIYNSDNEENSTVTICDNTADNELGATMYTYGGILENDPPPMCKYVASTNNGYTWYANTSDGTNDYTDRIQQSKQYNFNAAPLQNYIDVPDEIKGINNLDKYPIVFGENAIWRLEGVYSNTGGGYVFVKEVSNIIGAVGNNSIVKADNVLYFMHTSGFYATDGTRIVLISRGLEETITNILSAGDDAKQRVMGTYDAKNRRVYWACYEDSGSTENEIIMGYDIDSKSWFKWGGSNSSFAPASILVDKDFNLLRANDDSYLFKHNSDYTTDLHISGSDTLYDYIPHTYRTVNLYFNSATNYKWVPSVTITAEYVDNATLTLLLKSYDMDNSTAKELHQIRYVNYGETDFYSKSYTLPSGIPTSLGSSSIIKTRNFPGAALRTKYKSLQISNPDDDTDTCLFASDNYDTVTVSDGATTTPSLTLASGTWPSNILGLRVYIDGGYWPIASRDSNTEIQITTPADTISNGAGYEWEMYGVPDGEILRLKAITFDYAVIGDTGGEYKSAKDDYGND